MTEAQFEKSELQKFKEKFGRSSELTKVFDEWSESVQTFLLEQVKLENDESPILAFYQPHASWFLLTNRRLLWTNPDARLYELQLDDIEKVGWSSGPDGWAGRDPNDPPDTLVYINDASLVGKGHCGHYSPWLHFVDRSGKRFEAFLEKGNLKTVKNIIWQMSGGWKTSFERATKENHRIDKENADEVSEVKGTSPWLCFEDIHKQRHEALLPPGNDLFAIWNSMLFMVHLEKIHPLTSEK